MKQNVGCVDKIIRFLVGMSLFGYGMWMQNLWFLFAIIPVFTAVTGVCFLYKPFGLSTKTCDAKTCN